jgi:hypothetical protein
MALKIISQQKFPIIQIFDDIKSLIVNNRKLEAPKNIIRAEMKKETAN